MNREEYIKIAGKLADGLATEHEATLFNAYYNQYQSVYPEWDKVITSEKKAILEAMRQKITISITANQDKKRLSINTWITTIAAVIALLVFSIYFLKNKNQAMDQALAYKNDVAPGSHKAILTLANGKKINLSDAKSGIVIKASQLTYNDGVSIDAISGKNAGITTISTPRGGQYNIELPDGTIVALNASSTLKFPTTFLGLANRTVELEGEGYFEVAKDKKHSFIVKSVGQKVEVLGTHFNINAYKDEPVTETTLLEGSVEIYVDKIRQTSNASVHSLLKPNQHAVLNGEIIKIADVNPEAMVAWKNGYFKFDEESIQSVMRKLSRWYDIDVSYASGLPQGKFTGRISRSKHISQVLKLMESGKSIKFKIEGRRVIVIR
jgi:transmembrane sensor